MPLGNSNSFGKRTKTVSKIRRVLKKVLDELWDFRNNNWNSGNQTWDD